MKPKYILFLLALTSLVSCEQVKVKSDFNESYVSLYDSFEQYRLCVQSWQVNFYYTGNDVQRDTVWVKIESKGTIPVKDCQVSLSACKSDASTILNMPDAQPGVQYVPFDDPEVKKLMILHKGKMRDSIPVILLRDPSLQQSSYRLVIRMADSDDIKAADQRADSSDVAVAVIYVSDGLSQPSSWSYSFFLGGYGKVKHDFCIRHSGQRWDDAFINSLDDNTQTYYLYKFSNDLVEENAQRAVQGLPPLAESDGTLVEFPTNIYNN